MRDVGPRVVARSLATEGNASQVGVDVREQDVHTIGLFVDDVRAGRAVAVVVAPAVDRSSGEISHVDASNRTGTRACDHLQPHWWTLPSFPQEGLRGPMHIRTE